MAATPEQLIQGTLHTTLQLHAAAENFCKTKNIAADTATVLAVMDTMAKIFAAAAAVK